MCTYRFGLNTVTDLVGIGTGMLTSLVYYEGDICHLHLLSKLARQLLGTVSEINCLLSEGKA